MSRNKLPTGFIQIKLILGLNAYDKMKFQTGESLPQLDVNFQWAARLYLMFIKFRYFVDNFTKYYAISTVCLEINPLQGAYEFKGYWF